MGFKEPDDFARFLTIGAHAAAAVTIDLENVHEHRIIELERYARANKIWAVKVKRMRLPDLMCLRCGRRFESKGKSALELKLSDSPKAGREWWAGGMRDDDVFCFARVAINDDVADVGQVVYVTLESLQAAKVALVAGQRKAVSAGSEVAVSWPSWTPTTGGVVDFYSDSEIVIQREDGKRQTYRHHNKWPHRHAYVEQGDSFAAGEIVVSTVAPAHVACAGDAWDWFADLDAEDPNDRFAAVKAARWLNDGRADDALLAIADDAESDWRLAIEAAASLAARYPKMVDRLEQWALSGSKDGASMEAVFVLTELDSVPAVDALAAIGSDASQSSELRAAAVWGIGLGSGGEVERLIDFVADPNDLVALHASAALPETLSEGLRTTFREWLDADDLRRVAIAAHVLARRGEVPVLVSHLQNDEGVNTALVVRALGDLPRSEVEPLLAGINTEMIAAFEVLWVRERDWLRADSTEGGLDILERQRLML